MNNTISELQLLYSVPSLAIDESKGPPSFVFVTHQLILDEFPYQFPESAGFFVTNGWLGEPGEYHQRILVSKPDGSPLIDTTLRPFVLEDPNVPYTAITFFQGLEIEEPGIYWISVFQGEDLVREYPLHIGGQDELEVEQ